MKRAFYIILFLGCLGLASCGPGTVIEGAVRTQVASTMQTERDLRVAEETLVAEQVSTAVAATAQAMGDQEPAGTMPDIMPEATSAPGLLPGNGLPTPGLSPHAITAENAESMTQAYQQGAGVPGPVAFSPDGTRMAVGSSLGVYIYDSTSLELISFLPTLDWIRSVSFSPDGRWVAAGGFENAAVWVWNTGSEQLAYRFSPLSDGDIIDQLAFSEDGLLIAAAGYDVIGIFSLATGQLTRQIQEVENTYAIQFSPDGETLYAIGKYSRFSEMFVENPYYLEISTGGGMIVSQREPDWGLGGIESAAFSPDGSLAALGLDSGTILIMQPVNGRVIHRLAGSQDVARYFSISDDNHWLMSSSYQDLTLWDLRSGSMAWTQDASGTKPAAYHSLTGQVAVANWTTGEVKLLNPQDGAVQGAIELGAYVRSAVPAPGGEYLAVGSDLGVSLWSYPGLDSLLRFEGLAPDDRTFRLSSNLAFSPDGKIVAGGLTIIGEPATMMLWDAANGKELMAIPGYVTRLAFAPGGTWLAGAYDQVKIVDFLNGNAVREVEAAPENLADMAVSPDGAWLALVDSPEDWGQDASGKVDIFRMPDGTLATTFVITGTSLKAAVFTPDSQHLVIVTNDDIQVWAVGGEFILVDQIALPNYVYPNCLAFNPTGDVLAIGAYLDIVLMSYPGGIILNHLQGHTSQIYSLSFTPGGAAMISASSDGTVRVWAVGE